MEAYAMKNEKLAQDIIQNVGGRENVNYLTHCATRLRFRLQDPAKADLDALKDLNVLQVVNASGQLQVVIGPNVGDVYDDVMKAGKFDFDSDSATNEEKSDQNTGIVAKVFDILSGSFTPWIPVFCGSGLIKAFLSIMTMLGWMSAKSGTYAILAAAGNAVFYFLPILLGVTLAKKLNVSPYIAATIGAALLEPNFTALIKGTGSATSFLGIPVVLMSYSTTVIPILVSIVIYSFLERFLKRFIPSQLHLLFLPLLSLIIMVPLTVMIFGPFGVYVGKGIAAATAWIIAKSPILAGLLIGGFWIPIVVFGLHWAIIPIILSNIATNGSDPILAIAMGSVWAASGAGLGVLFKTKNAQLKEIAASGLIPGLLSGVTEPIIYGIFFRYKRSFAYAIAMSAVSGVIAGVLQVKATQLAGGIFTIPTFNPIWGYALSAAVAFFGTAALHWIFGFGEKTELASASEKAEHKGPSKEDFKTTNVDTIITSPVEGAIVPVKDINDSVFSSEAMGATVAIDPTSNVVKAPFSGKVIKVFPTLHAIGLLSDGGVEVLIHIGLDTVNLNGEGFTAHVKDNQKITAGQELISFDVEQIKAKGYDPVVLIIVTNQNEQQHLKKYAVSNEQVTAGNKLLEISNK